jgi:hypothetical protein
MADTENIDTAPWDVLLRAADRIEELAAKAVKRPEGWGPTTPTWHASCDIVTNDHNEAVAVTYGPARWPERDWIAAMCPAMAPHLVAMLRGAAQQARGHYDLLGFSGFDETVPVVRFARAILGEAQ